MVTDDHPNAQDFANKREHDAARLDEWRAGRAGVLADARRVANALLTPLDVLTIEYSAYREMVRDDVKP